MSRSDFQFSELTSLRQQFVEFADLVCHDTINSIS